MQRGTPTKMRPRGRPGAAGACKKSVATQPFTDSDVRIRDDAARSSLQAGPGIVEDEVLRIPERQVTAEAGVEVLLGERAVGLVR